MSNNNSNIIDIKNFQENERRDGRILDRSKYSKRTLDTFEILAAYFIDIYYNHLYIEAKKLRTNGTVHSVTEGYKHTLNAFLHGVENPKLYKKTLIGIHGFFLDAGISSISFAECIERITEEFIPKDYYDSVTKQQKISILKLVICQSNRVFIEKLVRKHLFMIIDYHNDADNIRLLQDEYIDVLIMERQGVYHRFISTQTKTNKSASHIDTALFENMQNEIKILCKDKYELKMLIVNLKKIIIKKEGELQESKEKSENVFQIANKLKNEVQELQNELQELQSELSTVKEASHSQASHSQEYNQNEFMNVNPNITLSKLSKDLSDFGNDLKDASDSNKDSSSVKNDEYDHEFNKDMKKINESIGHVDNAEKPNIDFENLFKTDIDMSEIY